MKISCARTFASQRMGAGPPKPRSAVYFFGQSPLFRNRMMRMAVVELGSSERLDCVDRPWPSSFEIDVLFPMPLGNLSASMRKVGSNTCLLASGCTEGMASLMAKASNSATINAESMH